MKFLFTAISGNRKVGPLPVTGSSKETCPPSCPLIGRCYASFGPANIHWSRLTKGESGLPWTEFLSKIRKLRVGTLWRHNQFGDFEGANDLLNAERLKELVSANKGKKVISYSHYPVLDAQSPHAAANRAAFKEANEKGFTVNLSGNSVAHADKLVALGIAPVVAIVPSDTQKNFVTPAGNRVVLCPSQTHDNVTCSNCGLCARPKREYIIAFKAHGNSTKFVNTIANAA